LKYATKLESESKCGQKKSKDFCFQKLGIFFIENENIATEYSLFILIFFSLWQIFVHTPKKNTDAEP
jgi:hypothetical protein